MPSARSDAQIEAYKALVARYDAGEPCTEIGRGKVHHALKVLGRKPNRKRNVMSDADEVRRILLAERLTSSRAVAEHFQVTRDYASHQLARLGFSIVEIRRAILCQDGRAGRPRKAKPNKSAINWEAIQRYVESPPTRYHLQWRNLTERERALMCEEYQEMAKAVGAWT